MQKTEAVTTLQRTIMFPERIFMKNTIFTTPHHCYARSYSAPETEAAAIRYLRMKRRREQPAGPRGERILVAEGDRFLRTLVGTFLYRQGYTIIEAVDGEDALLKFHDTCEPIDLLLLDMDMPKKNGREVYEEIRTTEPDIKVMFASAYPSRMMRHPGTSETGVYFLAKPFGPDILLEKIREVLDG